MDYQLAYSLYLVLDEIAEHLRNPFEDHSVTLEPREIKREESRWDVGIRTRSRFTEVKLNPSKDDVLEFLKRAGNVSDEITQIELVYANATGTILSTLQTLIRLAREADDDAMLRERIDDEQVKNPHELLVALGATPKACLLRMKVFCMPAASLDALILLRAGLLAPDHAETMAMELRQHCWEGIKNRYTLHISAIIETLRSKGVSFATPAERAFSATDKILRDAAGVLQECPMGLPTHILAAATGVPTPELPDRLRRAIAAHVIGLQRDRWIFVGRIPAIQDIDEPLERALMATQSYVHDHEQSSHGRDLVEAALALVRACYRRRPKSVVGSFHALEKPLKRLGKKHLVQELAELTIAAARLDPRGIADVAAQAQALICGTSWVLQRTGDLDGASLQARKSLDLGESIGDTANTAYVFKCQGRILRMQAESAQTETRHGLLEASAATIKKAIDEFTGMPAYGSTHQEVGDCYSLLARTYLVADDHENARKYLRRAHELIPADGGKDHLDLLILSGDLQAARGDFRGADEFYSKAITLPQAADVQISEMFARGHFQRARNYERLQQSERAKQDFATAQRIWLELDEYEESAKARWGTICLEGAPKQLSDALRDEVSHLVKVTAYDLYQERYPAPEAVSRRAAVPAKQLAQLHREAKKHVAVRYPTR